MSSTLAPRGAPARLHRAALDERVLRSHWTWLAGGLVLAFALPFVCEDLLSVSRDVYYAIYGLSVLLLLRGWLRATGLHAAELVTRRPRTAVVLGLLSAALLALVVVRTDTATSHPHGLAFTGALLWRGVFYGAIDGLLLSAFPIVAVFAAFGTRGRTKRAVVAIGTLALAVSLAFTAVYHVGYPDFRGAKLKKPLTGDLVWSAPTLLTLNPVGAVIAHVGLHTAAVVHSYDTTVFLPPHAPPAR